MLPLEPVLISIVASGTVVTIAALRFARWQVERDDRLDVLQLEREDRMKREAEEKLKPPPQAPSQAPPPKLRKHRIRELEGMIAVLSEKI